MNILKPVAGVLVLGAAVMFSGVGCQGADSQENVGQASDAVTFGDTSCETATKDVATGTVVDDFCSNLDANWAIYTGLNTTRTPSCEEQYLVGYGSLTGYHWAHARWAGTSVLSSTNCANAHVWLEAYTKSGGSWGTPITASATGVWNSGSGTCDSTGGTGDVDGFMGIWNVPGGDFHRLAARAYIVEFGHEVDEDVDISMTHPCEPG